MKKFCTLCGKEYEAVSDSSKYCSEECRKSWRKLYNAAWHEEHKKEVAEKREEFKSVTPAGSKPVHSSTENIRVINNYALGHGFTSYGKYMEQKRRV